jgi:hypothetical protein
MALVFALLNGVAPYASLSNAKLCSMPCCAGRPAHLAGSCAGGACHARVAVKTQQAEAAHSCEAHHTIAGMHEQGEHEGHALQSHAPAHAVMREHAARHEEAQVREMNFGGARSGLLRGPLPQSTAQPETAAGATASFRTPCEADCGAGVPGFAQLRRARDSAALAHAVQPRPPTPASLNTRL